MKEQLSDTRYCDLIDEMVERYSAIEGMEESEQIEIMREIDQYGLNSGLSQEDIEMAFEEANNF